MPRRNTIEIVITGKDESASKVLNSITQNTQALGKAALAGLGGLAAGFGAAGAALTKFAIDAAPLASIEEAFRGVAEASGESADKMLEALERGSSGMIRQADLMESYNKAAMLVSDTFANELPNAMGYLSKVSAATGQDMGFLLDSLVTGVGRLSPLILDNLGIQVNLTEAYDAYAASIGKTASELNKQEQQTALMNQVMEKLAVNTAAMPDVAGSAAAMLASLNAKVLNLKDSMGKALLPILTNFLDMALSLADKVLPLVEQAIKAVAETFAFFTGLGSETIDTLDNVSELGQKLGLSYKQIESAFIGVRDTVAGLVERFKEAAGVIGPVVKRIFEAVGQFVSWKDVLAALAVAVGSIVIPAIAGIVTAMAPLVATAVALVGAIALVRNAWEKDWGGMRTKLTEFWEGTVRPVLKSLWSWLSEKVPQAIETLRAFWENTLMPAFKTAGQILQPAIQALGEAFREVKAALTEAWEAIAPILAELGRTFAEALGMSGEQTIDFKEVIVSAAKVIAAGLKVLAKVITVVAKVIVKVMQGVQKFWDKHGKTVTKIVKALGKSITTIVNSAMKAIQTIVEVVTAIIEGDWDKFWAALKRIAETVSEAIRRLIDAWLEAVRRLFETVTDAIKKIWDAFWAALEKIADTIMEAIRRLVDSWLDALRRLFEAATDAIKRIWELFWGALESIADAISEAIKDIVDAFLSAIKSLFETVTDAIEKIWDAFWSAIESIAESVASAVEDIVDSFLSAIEGLFDTVTGTIEDLWEDFWDGIESVADSISSTVQSIIENFLDAIESAFDAVSVTISDAWDAAWAAIESTVTTVVGTIQTAIDNFLNGIETAFNTAMDGISGVVETAFNAIDSIIKSIIGENETGGVWGVIKTAWDSIKTIFDNTLGENGIWGMIKTTFDDIKDKIDEIMGANENSGIWGIFKSVWDSIKGIFSGALGDIVDFINKWIGKINDLIDLLPEALQVEHLPEIPWPPPGWPEAQFGANFDVPARFTKGLPLLVHPREHVEVTPASRVGALAAGNLNVNVYTTINSPMDGPEWEYLVEQALRRIQARGGF